jgi:3-oxoacyl-ACP reductase-like protein
MGILSNIFSKIFPSSHPAVTNAPAAAPAKPAAPAAPAPAQAQAPTAAPSASRPAAAPAAAPMAEVDVEQILVTMQKSAGQDLNWRSSIVDLLKLLNLDSSLQARKELAAELHYTGDTGDSAAMNIWLHRQVMNKLAANGGKVPADLKD